MIGIDLQNRKPIYEQIVERFQTLIVSGVLEPDSQMPSVRSLAMELSINPNTIQKAYAALEQEGNEGLKQKKQDSVFASLKELVAKGKELKIPCNAFVERARTFYQEGEEQRV